jgi:hypothetical protein
MIAGKLHHQIPGIGLFLSPQPVLDWIWHPVQQYVVVATLPCTSNFISIAM